MDLEKIMEKYRFKQAEESFLLMCFLEQKNQLDDFKKYLSNDFLNNIEKFTKEFSDEKINNKIYLFSELIRLCYKQNICFKKIKKEPLYIRKKIINIYRCIINEKSLSSHEILLMELLKLKD